MRRAIDANAGDAGEALRQRDAFKQNAGELGAVIENVVRPFDPERRIAAEESAAARGRAQGWSQNQVRRRAPSGAGSISKRLAKRLPGSDVQTRPLRPLPPLWRAAMIQRRPGSPERARCKASSLVDTSAS